MWVMTVAWLMKSVVAIWLFESPRPTGTAFGTRSTGGPGASARASIDDAEQRTHRQRDPRNEPRLKLVPPPVVHPDLATSPSLAAPDE
jgi:hypothetical protein